MLCEGRTKTEASSPQNQGKKEKAKGEDVLRKKNPWGGLLSKGDKMRTARWGDSQKTKTKMRL